MRHIGFIDSALAGLAAIVSLAAPACGITGGTDIDPTAYPAVGLIYGTRASDKSNRFGSGTIIQSNLSDNSTWVLTVAHNLFDGSLTTPRKNVAFFPMGSTGTRDDASVFYGYPDWKPNVGGMPGLGNYNDLALVRLSNSIDPKTIAPAVLDRTDPPPSEKSKFRLVGFGSPQDSTTFPTKMQKRQGDFTITKTTTNEFESKQDSPNSTRGDSGGAWFSGTGANAKLVGVHRAGNGTDTSDGTYVLPYAGWIDSYTQKSIFWDNLKITGGNVNQKDGFAGNYFKGVEEPWDKVAATGPGKLGNIPVDDGTGWRYMDSPALDRSGDKHSQGEVILGNTASVISRTFDKLPQNTALNIQIDNRFNSTGLADDLGVQVGAGAITWDTFSAAPGNGIDQWLTRQLSVNTGADSSITVYLLNAPSSLVPEPGSGVAAILCAGIIAIRRRRRPKPSWIS